jgi:dGTP triphosphohydrolase
MNDDYLKNETVNRKVIDYIAGMTDNYFLRQYENHCNMGKKEDEH